MILPPRLNLIGKSFERLTVISFSDISSNGKSRWCCTCSCGKSDIIVIGSDLLSGRTKSCGCLNKELIGKVGENNKTHGLTTSKEYNSWKSMLSRCENSTNDKYWRYGGSGIFVDEDLKDFEKFLKYIGRQPQGGLSYSVDRLDNNKGYVKGNIRWATSSQQARNKSKNSRNNTGITGVCFAETHGVTYAIATWVEDGRKRAKRFNVHKFGIVVAFAKACKYREEQIKKLNSLGYGYTNNHGK